MISDRKSIFRRRMTLAAGFLFLALGALGVILPVLPTTPFLLLAAAMFMRSSERLYLWLTRHRLFGRFIRNYRLYRAVPLRSKVIGLAFLWLTIGYSVVFAVDTWWMRALLLLIAAGVSWHILALRTLSRAMLEEIARAESLPDPIME